MSVSFGGVFTRTILFNRVLIFIKIRRSTIDGTSLDNVTSPTATHLYGATFRNNTFVAISLSGKIVWSSDNSSNVEKYEGEWKDEKHWNGIYYYKDGKIKGKFVTGKENHQ